MTDHGSLFRALHQPGTPFILANVWDAGSARVLAGLGAKALATSSAAHAFTLGRADGGTVTRDEAMAHAEGIVAATDLPVQGDFENGFGDDPDTCAETVRLAAEVGLAGICIEDTALPADTPYPFDLAVERIRAAAAAARSLPGDFVLTARADGVLTGTYDTDEAIRRLQGFAVAGADCLYAPMVDSITDTQRLIAAVDGPVNVLVTGEYTSLTMDDFATLGAARLSLGSSLARATHQLIHEVATEMLMQGQFGRLKTGIGPTIDALLQRNAAGQ